MQEVNFLKPVDLMTVQGDYKCHVYLGKAVENRGQYGGAAIYIKRVVYTNQNNQPIQKLLDHGKKFKGDYLNINENKLKQYKRMNVEEAITHEDIKFVIDSKKKEYEKDGEVIQYYEIKMHRLDQDELRELNMDKEKLRFQ